MEQDAPRKLTKSDVAFLLLYGAFQGALVAFFTALWSRHDHGHWESPRNLIGRFVIDIAIFSVGTLAMRKLFPRGFSKFPRTPMGARIQAVAFFVLMLGLAYALWKMY